MAGSRPFRAIIIGGGPVGLCMAHALGLAGIDYVLCEKRPEIADRFGAGLSVMPQAARILHQFGILKEAEALALPMATTAHVIEDGHGWRDNSLEMIGINHGYRLLLFNRYELIELLLRTLPDHEKRVKTSKGIKSIAETKTGVVVTFDDGTVEEGSIVIGADGVHSTVRRLLGERSPGKFDADPFSSHYWGVYAHGPKIDGIRGGETVERHDDGWAVQSLSREDWSFFFLYEKLPQPTNERKRFTLSDAEEFIKPHLNTKITKDVTFGDLWARRQFGNLRYLEQGISRTWSHGRVVLVGDAVHKVTPNIGIGGNIGIESAICLANHLHALLQTKPNPDTALLAEAFAAYQAQRTDAVKYWCGLSHIHMKFITFDDERQKQRFDSRASPDGPQLVEKAGFAKGYVETISQGIKLDYVPLPSELKGLVPWADSATSPNTAMQSKL
ncbi:hypothetical protein BX600DRAFT_231238 [Xylariales sp. PMI_506]|nr:hypothetical protein BX600DRAFT_231238 [Xylariales sp. PMI_506]